MTDENVLRRARLIEPHAHSRVSYAKHTTVRTHTGGLYCYAISGDVSHGEHQELERPDGPPSQALNLSRIITDQSDGKVVFTALRIDGIYYYWETLLRELAAKQTLRGVSVHLYG